MKSKGNIFTGNYISSAGVVVNLSKARGTAEISSAARAEAKNTSSVIGAFFLKLGISGIISSLSSLLGISSNRAALSASTRSESSVQGAFEGIVEEIAQIRNQSSILSSLIGKASASGEIFNAARGQANPVFVWHASTNIFNSSSDTGFPTLVNNTYNKVITGMISGVSRTLGNLTAISSLYGSALNYTIVKATQTGNLVFQLSGKIQGVSETQGTLWVLSNLYLTGPRPVWTLDYQPLHWVLD
jgi:hypothetical protein